MLRRRRSILRSGGTCFFFCTEWHDPDVRRLRVRFEIDIQHAEDHPLAIRRNFRLAHALQFHHVFKGKGMLGLGERRKRNG